LQAAETLKNQLSRRLKCVRDSQFWQRGIIEAGTGKIAIVDRTADFWGLRCIATAKAVRTLLMAETLALDSFYREEEGKISFFLPSVTSRTLLVAELHSSVQFCSFTVKSDR
jgi:hypothetical protein